MLMVDRTVDYEGYMLITAETGVDRHKINILKQYKVTIINITFV
jgi:hypothetical protein